MGTQASKGVVEGYGKEELSAFANLAACRTRFI